MGKAHIYIQITGFDFGSREISVLIKIMGLISNDHLHLMASRRAEKVAEITSWLKSHPVSSVTRTSCELQVLDSAIVEKIEEVVEKAKVTETDIYSNISI